MYYKTQHFSHTNTEDYVFWDVTLCSGVNISQCFKVYSAFVVKGYTVLEPRHERCGNLNQSVCELNKYIFLTSWMYSYQRLTA